MMLNEQNSDRFKIGIDNKFIRDDKNDIEV